MCRGGTKANVNKFKHKYLITTPKVSPIKLFNIHLNKVLLRDISKDNIKKERVNCKNLDIYEVDNNIYFSKAMNQFNFIKTMKIILALSLWANMWA